MALLDSMLNLVNKQPKDPNAPKPPAGSRSEREAKIKDKAGMVINVFALLLAVNAWYGGSLSSTVMNNTIKANDVYSFYQAKSIKQSLAEQSLYDAQKSSDKARVAEMKDKIQAGGDEWFVVHLTCFACTMIMIVLSYPIFGVFTDEQIGRFIVIWCFFAIMEGIHGLWGWKNDVSNTD